MFWAWEGRKVRILKKRSGGFVIPKHLSEVPAGFLGPETPEEIAACERVLAREPLAASVRFQVLKRDEYKCQLCGRKASDGVLLHIDHKKAVANGGTNDIENLWVLCATCNLGKATEEL